MLPGSRRARISRGPLIVAISIGLSLIGPISGQFLPRPPRDPRPEKARIAFEAGRFTEAKELLEPYVEKDPENADAWLFLGWSRYRLGEFGPALAAFEQALERTPGSADALVGVGYATLQLEGPAGAAPFFSRALESEPERSDALRGLVLAGRRQDAPANVVRQGALAARQLEIIEGASVESLLSSATLRAGVERRLRPPVQRGSIEVPTRAGKRYLEVRQADGTWQPLFIKGVNLGVTLPGRFASEFPTDEKLYREWLGSIASLGANSIRLYTLLPPAFYRALDWHNDQPGARKVWLIQGVWTELPPELDFSNREYESELREEISRIIDAVHGNIAIGPKRDHAWGSYDRDVSEHLLAYIIGREWEPFAVVAYNAMHPDRTSWSGRWLRVEQGNPMECWVAKMCDFAAEYEASNYSTIHPLTFANWPTLDPLHHPTESTLAEAEVFRRRLGLPALALDVHSWDDDAVAIDSTRIEPTAAMTAGFFAAYHIYPNFPDFMNNEYRDATDALGPNQYIGYLRDLIAYHGDQPVVVAEFGISTSRGIAHVQPLGWHHGGKNEREQGHLVARMLHNIHDAGYAGGIVFEFMDEWFKGTWNAAPYEIPAERRTMWFNDESPEQSYGLIAVRPASIRISIDGRSDDWRADSVYATD